MTGFVETHRSFVNTWECDENAHMNVQFYHSKFDEAARVFRIREGSGLSGYRLPVTRHVRYHTEMAAGVSTRIRTGRIASGGYAGFIVHLLEDTNSGRISATALDAPHHSEGDHLVEPAELELALPRSFPVQPAIPETTDTILGMGGLISSQTIVNPGECDADGRILPRAVISRFSDAAPHVWDCAGLTTPWLAANCYGRVAVEMKVTHHRIPEAGAALTMYSAVQIRSEKVIHIRHEMSDALTGVPYVSGEVAALVMDLKARKAVAIPDEIRQRNN